MPKKVVKTIAFGKLPVGAKATKVPGQRPFKAFRKVAANRAKRGDETIEVPPVALVEPTSEVVFNLIAPGTSKADRDRILKFFQRHAKPGRITRFKVAVTGKKASAQ